MNTRTQPALRLVVDNTARTPNANGANRWPPN
jgi:hypothetical protein